MSKFRIPAATVATLIGAALSGLPVVSAEAAPYQALRTSQNCSNRSLCNLPIASIPAGKTLEVRDVSCRYLIGTQTVEVLQASFDVLNGSSQVVFSENVVPTALGRSGVGTFFSLNHRTNFFVVGPNSIRAQVSTDAISNMLVTCSIAGVMTP